MRPTGRVIWLTSGPILALLAVHHPIPDRSEGRRTVKRAGRRPGHGPPAQRQTTRARHGQLDVDPAHGLAGPIRSQVRFGSCVGGSGLSPGSIVTWRGWGTAPPRRPRSMCSPGRSGISPGLCSLLMDEGPLGLSRTLNVPGIHLLSATHAPGKPPTHQMIRGRSCCTNMIYRGST